jgi:heat shock protein HtpX
MNRWHRDYGLEGRMFMTMFMLAAVYLLFLYALWIFGGVDTYGLIFIAGIMLFIQFFFSGKLALWSVGGRIVNELEELQLHQMISRLCVAADLPKPKIAILNAFFIIPALSADSIMRLFSTHPPIEERISALEEMERGIGF